MSGGTVPPASNTDLHPFLTQTVPPNLICRRIIEAIGPLSKNPLAGPIPKGISRDIPATDRKRPSTV